MLLWLNAPTSLFLLSQNQFRYPVWGQEPGSLTHRHCRLLTQKRRFSPAYYFTVGTSGNAVKCYIISAGLWLNYLHISLFIPIYQTAVGVISQVEFAKRGF